MAIGAITLATVAAVGNATPIFLDPISFLGDTSYPTGGTAAFQDTFQAKVGSAREILAVLGQDCGGYVPVYDKTNDKLKVYEEGADGGPADEVTATTALNAVTFNVLVISR